MLPTFAQLLDGIDVDLLVLPPTFGVAPSNVLAVWAEEVLAMVDFVALLI